MADQLREIFHNSQSPGSTKGLEEATSSDPVKTYDFDVDTLLMYLKGEEPQNYPEFMMVISYLNYTIFDDFNLLAK